MVHIGLDIGTTHIVMTVLDLEQGRLLPAISLANPQF
ncbi:MAG: hypothetical protein AB7D24_06770, partial [Sphaerochaeta sp.]